jgi:hypothetical protein
MIGIILSVISLGIMAIIIWGAFAEQKRGNADSAAALTKH